MFSRYLPSLPEYLASISFRNPSDPQKALFQYATGTDAKFFEWLHGQPKQFAQFSSAMAVSSATGDNLAAKTLLQLLPADEATLYSKEASGLSQQVLLVDVGGGRGQILNNVKKERPEMQGRMIVQDLPHEIKGRERSEEVESMAYDFFTPQPVMGTWPSGQPLHVSLPPFPHSRGRSCWILSFCACSRTELTPHTYQARTSTISGTYSTTGRTAPATPSSSRRYRQCGVATRAL